MAYAVVAATSEVPRKLLSHGYRSSAMKSLLSLDSFAELSDLAGLAGAPLQQSQSASTVHGHSDSLTTVDAPDTQTAMLSTQVQSPSAEADSPAHLDGEDLPPANRQPPSLADVTWILEHDIHN